MTKHYTNSEVTIVWKPEQCTHSTLCWRGLKEVFDPRVKPWVKIEGSTTDRIIDQVKKCPSGALSYFMNVEGENEQKAATGTDGIGQTGVDQTQTDQATTGTAIAHTDQVIHTGTITSDKQDIPSQTQETTTPSLKVAVTPKGPYILNTQCVIIHPDGREEIKEGVVALCRCGASNNKPYCDGRHHEIAFEG